MKTWYTRYGFADDPFDTEPAMDDELIEYQDLVDDLLYRIEAGSMVFVEGPQGAGKTALLIQAIRAFEGKGRVIYYDCAEIKRKAEIDELMKNRYGFFGRMLGRIPHDMIVLLDNVQHLSRENAERIKFYFDQGYIRSVVFSGETLQSAHMPQSIKDRIGIHVIKLRPLSDYGAVELLGKRLGEQNALITDEATKFVFAKAGRNTKKFLALCSKLFSALMPQNSSITLDDAKKVLKHV